MTRIFLSYSRKDTLFTSQLKRELERSKFDVWVDVQSIVRGEEFMRMIRDGIESSELFLFVMSSQALMSRFCHYELSYARKLNRKIIPIVIERVEDTIFDAVLGTWFEKDWETEARENWTFLRSAQWSDFTRTRNFEVEFNALLEDLHVDLEYLQQYNRFQARARLWEKNNRQFGFLTDLDLSEAQTWLAVAVDKQPAPDDITIAYIAASQSYVDGIEATKKQEAERVAALEGDMLKMQQELLSAQVFAELGARVSGLLHDLVNQLVPRRGALELIEEELDNLPANRQSIINNLRYIEDGIAKVFSSLDDFRENALNLVSLTERIAINAILKSTMKDVPRNERVTIIVEPAGSNPSIMVKKTMITYSLYLLITNAMQAMSASGGTITLTASQIEEHVRVTVKDSGPGIPVAIREKVFKEPIRSGRSSGLGLLTVAYSIENNGGKVWFNSEEGAGTTFTIEFPISPA